MQPDDATFRTELEAVLERSGLSKRQLSLAMGRDVGYVAALMDPSRPSRARPTPDDLLRLSDATGIPLVDLLESLAGVDRTRLETELAIDQPRRRRSGANAAARSSRPRGRG